MNMRKVILLSFGLLMVAKANQAATQHPDLMGLRCEFNGEIEFSINPSNIETDQALGYIFENLRDKSQSYDAADPREVLVSKNGKFTYRLRSMQWIWIARNTPIQITLKPNPCIHELSQEHVYFFNIFSKPLYIELAFEEHGKLKDTLFVRNSKCSDSLNKPIWQCDCKGEDYSMTLAPGESIIYPASSGVNVTLKN
jgi:hypothetical protein